MTSNFLIGAGFALASLGAQAQIAGPVTLNDSGMARCVTPDGRFTHACAGTGQDGETGRDATAPRNGDGHAGFKLHKVGYDGKPLPRDAPVWRCVADQVTGLVWEVKTTNGGTDGTGYSYTNYGDGSAGDTSTLIAEANAKQVCGASNWRLPTITELQSMIDYGAADGALVDAAFFPNTRDTWYWASTEYAGDPAATWAVYFSAAAGGDGAGQRMFKLGARLVHDTKFAPPVNGGTRYTYAGDEVTDHWTRLVWRRCSAGQTFDGAACTGKVATSEWIGALKYAKTEAEASGLGWRVPNPKEYSTIADRTRSRPALDPAVFPNGSSGFYWTSTPMASDPTQVWSLDFSGAYTQPYPGSGYLMAVRLVRDLAGE